MDHIPVILAAAALIGLAITAAAALCGWRGWLGLKLREIELQRGDGAVPAASAGPSSFAGMTARIEIADLKERIRKLEAIAAGVDL